MPLPFSDTCYIVVSYLGIRCAREAGSYHENQIVSVHTGTGEIVLALFSRLATMPRLMPSLLGVMTSHTLTREVWLSG